MRGTTGLAIALATLIFWLVTVQRGRTTIYYLDSGGGSDAAAGTSEATAWKSLGMLARRSFAPGDIIRLKRGEVWYEEMVLASSGSPESPIVVEDYGDSEKPRPRLVGTAVAALNWEPVPGMTAIYRTVGNGIDAEPGLLLHRDLPRPPIATLFLASAKGVISRGAVALQLENSYCNMQVTAVDGASNRISGITFFRDPQRHWQADDGVEIRQADVHGRETSFTAALATSGLQTDPRGLTRPGDWYWDSAQKAVYLFAESDPASGTRLAVLKTGIRLVNGHDLIIRNLDIHGFGETGVHLNGADSVILDDIGVGAIGFRGHKTAILLENSSNCIVRNCRVESPLVCGIGIYSYDRPSRNNRIIDNHILASGAAAVILNTDSRETASLVTDNTIAANVVEGANSLAYDSGGIYALNIGPGNILSENTIVNGGSRSLRSAGIMIDGGVSPMVIRSNIAENNSLGGIVVSGAGHLIENNRLRRNGVSAWDSAQLVFFPVIDNPSGCTVRDNVMEDGGGGNMVLVLKRSSLPQTPIVFDNNTYGATAPLPFCLSEHEYCDRWVDFSTWKLLTGQDSHSVFEDLRWRPGEKGAITGPLSLLL